MSRRDSYQPPTSPFFSYSASPRGDELQLQDLPTSSRLSHHRSHTSISTMSSGSPEYRTGRLDSTATLINPQDYRHVRQNSHRPAALQLSSEHKPYSPQYPNANEFGAEAYSLPPTAQDPEFQPLVAPSRSTHYNPSTYSRSSSSKGGHPFFPKYFERPLYLRFFLHFLLCGLAFPIIYFIPTAKTFQGIPLFWARLVAGLCCSAAGLLLGFSLLEMSRPALEAAVWATMIHESMVNDQSGITVAEYHQYCYDPQSPWTAVVLFYRRLMQHKGTRRSNRSYDRFPWSLTILYFLSVVGIAASLPFIFGRVVQISTAASHQVTDFKQTQVIGDLSPEDVARADALRKTFEDYAFTWTLSPYAESANLPKPVVIQNPNTSELIYFAEAYSDQLDVTKTGFGTFNLMEDITPAANNSFAPQVDSQVTIIRTADNSALIRYPRWGVRLACDYLPDIQNNLIPVSPANNTVAFIPRSAIEALLTKLNLTIPDATVLPNTVDLTANIAKDGDEALASRNMNGYAYAGKWPPNGIAASFFSQPLSMGGSGRGWLEMESVLIRLNTAFAPSGNFGVVVDGPDGKIGYDMVVCVEAAEPWILDVFNTTAGSPKTVQGNLHTGNTPQGWASSAMPLTAGAGVSNILNSTNKVAAWIAAHDNSRNVLIKDNGRDAKYVPSPTVVSFSTGGGPNGYDRLSPPNVADILGRADAVQLLPYLVGSQKLTALVYPDRVSAYCDVDWLILTVAISLALALGFVAAFFIPRLPLGLPRRDFGLFSWIAEGDRLMDPTKARKGFMEQREDLEEVKEKIGSKKIRLM